MFAREHKGSGGVLYTCSLDDTAGDGDGDPSVKFTLGSGAPVGRTSEEAACLCENGLNGVTLMPNVRYKYTGNCEVGENCAGFHPVFSGPEVTAAIAASAPECTTRVEAIILHAYGAFTPGSNPNPYAISQEIPIDTIEVRFSGERHKDRAECEWSVNRVGDGQLGVGHVQFISNPAP